jgi:hypothetical protein
MRPDWMDRALCREYDPDAWFPEDSAEAAVAQHICDRCPVRAECEAYAIARGERFGVWGGKVRGRRDGGDGFCRRCRAVVVAGHGVRYCADCRAEAKAETRARARARAAS